VRYVLLLPEQRSDTTQNLQLRSRYVLLLPEHCCFQSRGEIQLRTSSPEVGYVLLLPELRPDTTLNVQPRGQIRTVASTALLLPEQRSDTKP
jgi:hypothetical protein